MGTHEVKKCKCGGMAVVRKDNKGKWNVICSCCQKFYTRNKDSREEAIAAWNNNIESVCKKAKNSAAKKQAAKK